MTPVRIVYEALQPGDEVINISPKAKVRGPFKVIDVEDSFPEPQVHIHRRSHGGHAYEGFLNRSHVVRIELGQSVQQALIAHVPANLRCQICNLRPGSESHFITVPIPKAFTRLCVEDRTDITQEIRKRVSATVAEVFAEAKAKQLKKTLQT